MLKKIDKSYNFLEKNVDKLACPLCQSSFDLSRYSLRCQKGHQFDINKKGFVNFLNHKVVENYTKEMFEPRGRMIRAGMYEGVLEYIKKNLLGKTLLDVGCGEGSHLSLLNFDGENFAFDIARDGINLATNQDIEAFWAVADLTKLPYANSSMDNILNIFTPSNYDEFRRVLSENGQVIKVVPDKYYLQELRKAYKLPLDYDNSKVIAKFKEEFPKVTEEEVYYEFQIPEELRNDFLKMSPLEWQVDDELLAEVKNNSPKTATVNVKILIGSYK
ncbi:putative RNA methyltransferase [Floricoccus penangensis]|uniref:putative RNA methyltransferase n=1 Tax=Floricoccus penangensis TaxID=1859475 RepID=UPI0020416A5C|nr:methyltransferase domain-containing protein [Floricoccus penangensis]URZ87096.1 methyltransferase domain-containing protein [Floricoccus penangensis]